MSRQQQGAVQRNPFTVSPTSQGAPRSRGEAFPRASQARRNARIALAAAERAPNAAQREFHLREARFHERAAEYQERRGA